MTTPHPDPAVAEARVRAPLGIRDKQIANACASTLGLPMLASTSFNLAACEYALGRDEAARRSLALGLDAVVATLEAAAAPGAPLHYSIQGQRCVQPSQLGPGSGHAGVWRQAFEAGTLLADRPALQRLAAIPLSLPLRSPARPDDHLAQWLHVLHTWLTQSRFDADRMLAALEATEPGRLDPEMIDFTLAIEVPAMALAWRIALADAPAAEAALADALAKHERYWSRAGEASAPDGFVAWRLSAWKALAAKRGLALATRSRYLFEATPVA
jgi:hypothetical protein